MLSEFGLITIWAGSGLAIGKDVDLFGILPFITPLHMGCFSFDGILCE